MLSAVQRHPTVSWVLVVPAGRAARVHCEVCGASATIGARSVEAFAHQHRAHRSSAPGYHGAGDAVAALTGRLGMTPCTPCEQRRMALNRMVPRLWRR